MFETVPLGYNTYGGGGLREEGRKEGMEMKNVLCIHAEREGYAIDQIYRTMTVGELIGYLEQFDEDTPVYLDHDNGYTFGGITERRFYEAEAEGDEEVDDEAEDDEGDDE